MRRRKTAPAENVEECQENDGGARGPADRRRAVRTNAYDCGPCGAGAKTTSTRRTGAGGAAMPNGTGPGGRRGLSRAACHSQQPVSDRAVPPAGAGASRGQHESPCADGADGAGMGKCVMRHTNRGWAETGVTPANSNRAAIKAMPRRTLIASVYPVPADLVPVGRRWLADVGFVIGPQRFAPRSEGGPRRRPAADRRRLGQARADLSGVHVEAGWLIPLFGGGGGPGQGGGFKRRR